MSETGQKLATRFAAAEALVKGIKLQDWNEYHITARGPHIMLRINGEVTAEPADRETGKATASGVLAMPIIPGEPMKVQYKDIQLKMLGKKAVQQASNFATKNHKRVGQKSPSWLPNDEGLSSNDERMTKPESLSPLSRHLDFGLLSSFVLRHSSLSWLSLVGNPPNLVAPIL